MSSFNIVIFIGGTKKYKLITLQNSNILLNLYSTTCFIKQVYLEASIMNNLNTAHSMNTSTVTDRRQEHVNNEML